SQWLSIGDSKVTLSCRYHPNSECTFVKGIVGSRWSCFLLNNKAPNAALRWLSLLKGGMGSANNPFLNWRYILWRLNWPVNGFLQQEQNQIHSNIQGSEQP
ncbi:hypothetical protein ACFL1X_13805, partial [Candidatus Hydrogenedentota bacterium]